jgi:hypothetical protein
MSIATRFAIASIGFLILFVKIIYDLYMGATEAAPLVPISNDMLNQWWPFYEHTRQTVLSGHLPLWSPYTSLGAPIVGEIGLGIFYPLTWLIFLLEVPYAILVMQLGTVLIGVLGMSLYTRYLGLSSAARVLTAGIFAYTVLTNTFSPSLGSSYCWFPFILWSAHQIIDRPGVKSISIMTALLTLCFLAGFPNYFYYTCLITGVYFLVLLCFSWKDIGSLGFVRRSTAFGLAVLVMLGLVAIQLVPMLGLSSLSVRDVGDSAQNIQQSMFENYSLTAIVKNYFRMDSSNWLGFDFWFYQWSISVYYLGGALLLMPFALLCKKNRPVVVASVIAGLFFLCFIFSTKVPLLSFLQKIPLADSLRVHIRGIDYVQFFMILAAGIGLSHLTQCQHEPAVDEPTADKAPWWKGWLLPLLFAAYTLALIVITIIVSHDSWFYGSIVLGGTLLLGTLIYTKGVTGKSRPTWRKVGWATAALILLDVSIHRQNFFPTPLFLEATKGHTLATSHENEQFFSDIAWIKENAGDSRVLFVPSGEHDTLQLANVGPKFQIANLSGYNGFTLNRWKNYVALMVGQEEFDRLASQFVNNLFYGSLTIEMVASMLEEQELLETTSLRYLFKDGQKMELPNAFPRAYAVEQYLLTDNEQESLAAIYGNKSQLRELVVLENAEPSFPSTPRSMDDLASTTRVQIESYESNKVLVRVVAKRPSLLVLTDSFVPGWRAYINGQRSPIYRANSVFRAVELPAGESIIEFRYVPSTLILGAVISSMTLLLVLTLLLLFTRRKRTTETLDITSSDTYAPNSGNESAQILGAAG